MFNYNLKQKIKKIEAGNPRFSDSFQSYECACRILLLCERDAYEVLLPEIDGFRQTGKELEVLVIDINIQCGSVLLTDTPDYVIVLTPSDFSRCSHTPVADILKFLKQHRYDVMIDVSTELNYPMLYLAYIIPASCKMGLKKGDTSPYQFMIQSTQQLTSSEVWENLLFYWKKIDIKKNNS